MKTIILVVCVLCVGCFAQNGGTVPPPDIVGAAGDIASAPVRAQTQAAQAALIRQQTELLKQQTEALKQQNALLEEQRKAASIAARSPEFLSPVRKPRIDDIDAATGKPRFATYADYEDAKDEWIIEEAIRRFEATEASSTRPTTPVKH